MKYFLLILVLSFLNSYSQNKTEIYKLNSESKIVGEIAYPMLYHFKANKLILNGAGIRKSSIKNGYSCALYLENPETNPENIVEKDDTMIIRLDILSKKIAFEKTVEAFKKDLEEANTVAELKQIQPEIELFIEYLEELTVAVGAKLDIVYEPYKGTSIYLNYKKQGTVTGFGLKKALFNIWLSKTPADKVLKQQLLDGANGYVF